MDKIDSELLLKIAELHGIPEGSYNIRKDGTSIGRHSDPDVQIVSKSDKDGIDIIVRAGVKGKSVHIPVLLTKGGMLDTVYNDFYIGKGAEVTIIAGCGIHNDECGESRHDGVHTFHLDKGSKVTYIERHYAEGDGGKKSFSPVTKAIVGKDACLIMESTQLGGVSYTDRKTEAVLRAGAKLIVKEKILTDADDVAHTYFKVKLMGEDSSADIVSRSVARDNSRQKFVSDMIGKSRCFGHVECDGILMDNARIVSSPRIDAISPEASLVHEAAVGKIAGEQLIKLMSLGLTDKQAEDAIIEGFLN